jgi:hypothetical protein
MGPLIEKALELIKVLSGDERARPTDEAAEKARMDLRAWRDDARVEGWRQGRQAARPEAARNLPRARMPLDGIVGAAGLSH